MHNTATSYAFITTFSLFAIKTYTGNHMSPSCKITTEKGAAISLLSTLTTLMMFKFMCQHITPSTSKTSSVGYKTLLVASIMLTPMSSLLKATTIITKIAATTIVTKL